MTWEYEIWADGQFVDSGAQLEQLERPPGSRCVLDASTAVGDEVEAALEAAQRHRVEGLLLSDARDRHAGAISRLDAVESLDLTHSPVTDAVLPAVGELPRLRSLALRSTRVTGAGLTSLVGRGTLRTLDLTQCALASEVAETLGRLGSLRELWLDRTGVPGARLEPIGRLAQLERLGLASLSFGPGDLQFVQRLSRLLHLDLQGEEGLADEDLASLAPLGALVSLSLAGRADVLGPGLRHLGALTRLEELDLSETLVTGQYLAHLAPLPLARLVLRETPLLCDEEALADEEALGAAECREQATADLEGVEALARSRSLRHLDLAGATVTDEAVRRLAALSALEVLVLEHTPVSPEALTVFEGHPALQTVRMGGQRLSLRQAVARARSGAGGAPSAAPFPPAEGIVEAPSGEPDSGPGGLSGLMAALSQSGGASGAGDDALLADLAADSDDDLPEDVRAALDAEAPAPSAASAPGGDLDALGQGLLDGLLGAKAPGGASSADADATADEAALRVAAAEEEAVRPLLEKLVEAGKIELVEGATLDALPPGLGAILAQRSPPLRKAEAFTEWLLEQEDVIDDVYYADEELAEVLEVW